MSSNVLLIFTGFIDSPNGNYWPLNSSEKNGGIHYLIPCYNSIVENLINPNRDYKIDTLFYCWGSNTKLIESICSLYNPVDYKFTNEHLENPFSSKFKGNKLAWNLAKTLKNFNDYKYFMFLRPDLLFCKNIYFKDLNYNYIYHDDGRPDEAGHYGLMYFLMNRENSEYFSSFFDIFIDILNKYTYTDNILRTKYLPVLEKFLSDKTNVHTYLRTGSAKEIEVFRKSCSKMVYSYM